MSGQESTNSNSMREHRRYLVRRNLREFLHLLETVSPPSMTVLVGKLQFRTGPTRKNAFGPAMPLIRSRNTPDDDLQPLKPRRLRYLEPQIPRFTWHENSKTDWLASDRKIRIIAARNGKAEEVIDSDRGVNMLTLQNGTKDDRILTSLWMPPEGISLNTLFFFEVTTPEYNIFCSEPFLLSTLEERIPVQPKRLANCSNYH
jgi:hypothetical protein